MRLQVRAVVVCLPEMLSETDQLYSELIRLPIREYMFLFVVRNYTFMFIDVKTVY